jgi:DNA-binding LacI/PurR family transcriptional regulator
MVTTFEYIMSITLKDVARFCGVDTSTVSRALHNDVRIKESTKQKVQKAAERLGYRPNIAARLLVEGHSHIFWFLVPTVGTSVDSRISEYASSHAARNGYDTAIVVHHGNQTDFERLTNNMGSGLAAGAIINRRDISDISKIHRLVEKKFPVVFIDVPVDSTNTISITTDNSLASKELVTRCLEAKASRFVLLFDPKRNIVEQYRYNAALDTIARNGAALIDANDPGAVKDFFNQNGTVAVLASAQSEIQAFFRSHAVAEPGLTIVAGCFDDWYGEPNPATTVFVAIQDYRSIAELAVDTLLGIIQGNKMTPMAPVVTLPIAEYRVVHNHFTT